MNACLSPKKAKQLTVLVHLCQLSISDIVLPGKNEARTSFHNVLASSVLSCCSENSTVRGNDCQNPPPENKLIPRLIIVTTSYQGRYEMVPLFYSSPDRIPCKMAFSTSSALGIDRAAPLRVTLIAAAVLALLIHSVSGRLFINELIKNPV